MMSTADWVCDRRSLVESGIVNLVLVRGAAAHPFDIIFTRLSTRNAVAAALEQLAGEEASVNLPSAAHTCPAQRVFVPLA